MAKKSKRRTRARAAAKQVQSAGVSQPAVATEKRAPGLTTAGRPAPATVEKAPAARATDLAGEYRYVIGDLKRIGVLAASMLALLVALALLAQYVL